MPTLKTTTTLAAALCAGALLAASPFASAGHDAPPPPDGHGEHGGPRHGDGHGDGRGHGPRGPHGGPFLHALKSLDLSDAQREAIRGAMKSSWSSARAGDEALHALRHQAMTTAPTAPGRAALVNRLADAEADAARDRVQKLAALQAEVYGMLTDAQRAQLAEKLKALPERGPQGEKTGWKPR